MSGGKVLVYLFRRDLRLSDNPILHHLATSKDHGFTRLLPVFIFPAHQIEISGFLKDGEKSPYQAALSAVAKYWRCGPHRARFIAQSVWDLKSSLESINSTLVLRVGSTGDVVKQLLQTLKTKHDVAVWMTEEKSDEEIQEQDDIATICSDHDVKFKLWDDEKYFIDDRDTGLESAKDLPDVFTTYRKTQEPLRERPRKSLPKPKQLPELPQADGIYQQSPFTMPDSLADLENRLTKPLTDIIEHPPSFPDNVSTAHPFKGGETNAQKRMEHLVSSGAMSRYKDTRNGLLGPDFSTKLSAYLALGCITARQVHHDLLALEDGTKSEYKEAEGYGKGENDGTRAVRFELLWRDYMRLCTRKFGRKLFYQDGFKQEKKYDNPWKTPDRKTAPPQQSPPADKIASIVERFNRGTTGMGLIDASQRELYHTGYTSNRARQNVASFLAKHLGIDWRYGAEWYEMLLIDYDVSSNWANWQYVAGVGNDPRGSERTFNPVKQAFDYDTDGAYVRSWVPELNQLEKLENIFQPCTSSRQDLDKSGLSDNVMVTDPLKRINFTVGRKPRGPRKTFPGRKGRGPRRGGGGGRGGFDGNTSGSTDEVQGNQHRGGYDDNQHDSGYSGNYGANQSYQTGQGYSAGYGYQDQQNSYRGQYSSGYDGYNNQGYSAAAWYGTYDGRGRGPKSYRARGRGYQNGGGRGFSSGRGYSNGYGNNGGATYYAQPSYQGGFTT